MDEDKTKEKPEKANETEETGVQSQTDTEVERLNTDTERINEAIAKNENAKARQKLGGVTEAGKIQEKPKEETAKEYKDRAMSGDL